MQRRREQSLRILRFRYRRKYLRCRHEYFRISHFPPPPPPLRDRKMVTETSLREGEGFEKKTILNDYNNKQRQRLSVVTSSWRCCFVPFGLLWTHFPRLFSLLFLVSSSSVYFLSLFDFSVSVFPFLRSLAEPPPY